MFTFSSKRLKSNAVASIQLGFEDFNLAKNDARRIISSIRNLYAGTILLLKWALLVNTKNTIGSAIIAESTTIIIKNNQTKEIVNNHKTIGRVQLKKRFEHIGETID